MSELRKEIVVCPLVCYELDPGLIDEIRASTNFELVIGNDKFKEEIADMLKRKVTPSKRGRPFKRQDIPGQGEQLTLLAENK